MTVKAHGTRQVYGGATTQPLAHVRTVQVKRKPLGWLDCNVDEFLRLLALHESGKIDLLQMPETSANDCDDLDDETPVEQVVQAAPEVNQRRPVTRNKASAGMVRQVVATANRPLTVDEIARKAQLSPAAVRSAIRRGRAFFACAGVAGDGHTKLWRKVQV